MINLFLVALASLFVYFKVTATTVVATWSWFWVLSPIILPYAIVLFFLLLSIILIAISGGKVNISTNRKRIGRR